MGKGKICELELALRAVIYQAIHTASAAQSTVYRHAQQFGEQHNMDESLVSQEAEMRLEPLLSAVELLREADRLILCADDRIDRFTR